MSTRVRSSIRIRRRNRHSRFTRSRARLNDHSRRGFYKFLQYFEGRLWLRIRGRYWGVGRRAPWSYPRVYCTNLVSIRIELFGTNYPQEIGHYSHSANASPDTNHLQSHHLVLSTRHGPLSIDLIHRSFWQKSHLRSINVSRVIFYLICDKRQNRVRPSNTTTACRRLPLTNYN